MIANADLQASIFFAISAHNVPVASFLTVEHRTAFHSHCMWYISRKDRFQIKRGKAWLHRAIRYMITSSSTIIYVNNVIINTIRNNFWNRMAYLTIWRDSNLDHTIIPSFTWYSKSSICPRSLERLFYC